MDYFGPVLRTPRVLLSDSATRRSGSLAAGVHLAGRRPSVVSAYPRSRSSFGCTMSDIGRDGSLVTRQMPSSFSSSFSSSSSPLYPRAAMSSFHPGASFTGHRTFPGRERSFSIGPVAPRWSVSRSEIRDLSSSPVRAKTPYRPYQQQQHQSLAPRFARRDSFSQPYYTVNSDGSSAGGVVLKRTSLYGPQFCAGSVGGGYGRSGGRAVSLSAADGQVLAESNVVSRRTSMQRMENDAGDGGSGRGEQRVSVYRSGTPSSSFHGRGRTPVASYASLPMAQRGSLSSMPPVPVRKISVVAKPGTTNGPRSSIEIVELENVPSQKKREIVESHSQPTRQGDFFKDLRKRTLEAKDRLGKHRMLLDRYLPIKLGPETEVAFEIQNKYGELVERLPFIERRHVATAGEADDDHSTKTTTATMAIIKPYTPAPVKFQPRVHVPSSFTPTISETRRKARDVLCRVKNDPNYFNYNV